MMVVIFIVIVPAGSCCITVATVATSILLVYGSEEKEFLLLTRLESTHSTRSCLSSARIFFYGLTGLLYYLPHIFEYSKFFHPIKKIRFPNPLLICVLSAPVLLHAFLLAPLIVCAFLASSNKCDRVDPARLLPSATPSIKALFLHKHRKHKQTSHASNKRNQKKKKARGTTTVINQQ
jgi:hypothetical protein